MDIYGDDSQIPMLFALQQESPLAARTFPIVVTSNFLVSILNHNNPILINKPPGYSTKGWRTTTLAWVTAAVLHMVANFS